ncbi:DUF4306 domain-containing protein [Peribacillus sp. SI8-4]|uniref:DUF4306 domain-containing protein n=1 Tax=Peribacillus sp. SI8-4 TaxID=3048009 RepID=UPI002554B837|nr:DUF4306 domain-containing protein [Peribacillus sp. SI8-4]
MAYNYMLQMIMGALFFILFSFCSWYEGSEILDNSWEWEYSTHFSGNVSDADDISNLDYFVYAAKFKPLFPVLMTLTASYMILLTGFRLFKSSRAKKAIFLSGLGALFLFSSAVLFHSPTVGGDIYQVIFLSGGMLLILAAALYYFRLLKGFVTVK